MNLNSAYPLEREPSLPRLMPLLKSALECAMFVKDEVRNKRNRLMVAQIEKTIAYALFVLERIYPE
jgi:hypothetical protein